MSIKLPPLLTIFKNHWQTESTNTITIFDLMEMAQNPRVGSKNTAPLITPYHSTQKTAAAAQQASYAALVVDHDENALTEAEFLELYGPSGLNVPFLAFTTSSHTKKKPRWKVIIPYAIAAPSTTAAKLAAGIAHYLGADPAQARVQQGFYAPNKLSADSDYSFIHQLETPDKWLHPDDTNSFFYRAALQGWTELQEEQNSTAQSRPKIQSSLDKAFKSYRMEDILQRHGYTKHGVGLYLAPSSTSGNPGVKLYQHWSGREVLYSHHGLHDPLSAQNHHGRALDVADVLRTLEYGGNFSRMLKEHAPEAQVNPLRPVALRDAMLSSSEVSFAVKPYLPKQHVTLLSGHGGVGKSMLALIIAAHVATGVPFAEQPTEQSRVLFVSLEDDGGVTAKRLREILHQYELDEEMVLANLEVLESILPDAAFFREKHGTSTMTSTYRVFKEKAKEFGLIIIDNASDVFDGNENSRRSVNAFIRVLTELARSNNAAVLLLSHIDKHAARFGGNQNDFSGSTAWHNGVRSRLSLKEESQGSKTAIFLEHQKANLTSKAEPLKLKFVENGVLVPLQSYNSDDSEQDAAKMLELISIAIREGFTVPGRFKAGNGSALQALEPLKEYPETFKTSSGKKRATAALYELKRTEQIKLEVYRDSNRNQKKRIILANESLREENVSQLRSAPRAC